MNYDKLLHNACLILENDGFESFLIALEAIVDRSDQIQLGMLKAIKMANEIPDAVNSWFFSHVPSNYDKPVIWLAKVANTYPERFVWSVGVVSSLTHNVRQLLADISKLDDELLQIPESPPYLYYMNPIACSQWQMDGSVEEVKDVYDFDIFQVSYNGENIKRDLEYQMLMNCEFIRHQAEKIQTRVNFSCSQRVIDLFADKVLPIIEQTSVLHVELHNWGHFVGFLPFAESKNIPAYEAIEEFRACVVGAYIGFQVLPEHLHLPLALTVLFDRLMVYGFEPYLQPDKTHQDAREISVAAFFFHHLEAKGCLSLNHEGILDIVLDKLVECFSTLASAIQMFEKEVFLKFVSDFDRQMALQEYAIDQYNMIYPDRVFPVKLAKFFNRLQVSM